MPTHPPILGTRLAHWADEPAAAAFAQALATAPALRGAFLSLDGDLGAGKTTLARHLLQALGVQGRIKSPTYAVVETYALAGGDAAHFDFYRFTDPAEWEDAGLREQFALPGLKLVEWASQAGDLLPAPDLHLRIDGAAGPDRQVRATAHTPTGMALLAALDAAGLTAAPGALPG